jgi:hypothetical protein
MKHEKQDRLSLYGIKFILNVLIVITWTGIIVEFIPEVQLHNSMDKVIVFLGTIFIILSTIIILYGTERYMLYISYIFTILFIVEAIIYFTIYNGKSQALAITYVTYILIFVVNCIALSIKFLVRNISYSSLIFTLLILVAFQNLSFLNYQKSELAVEKYVEENVSIKKEVEFVEKDKYDNLTDFIDSSEVSGGVVTDGKVLNNIRIGKHPDFERIVFDIYEYIGDIGASNLKVSDTACYYNIKYNKSNNNMTIVLSGVRFSNVPKVTNINSPNINYIKEIIYEDDSAFCYEISFKQSLLYKAYVLENPARIVIDIKSK